MKAFIAGKNVFAILPTGYGKSIIYAILPKLCDKIQGIVNYFQYIWCIFLLLGTTGSIVVCISPLTSIMMDQQEKFIRKGIKAELVGDAQTDQTVFKRVFQGDLQLLYISPESLLNNKKFRSMFLNKEYKERFIGLAVDEAHCIKTWLVQFYCHYWFGC